MTELLSTFPGGIVTGAVYALLAMGLVLIYKATRVPNFAYGAMATIVAFFHYDLVDGRRVGFGLDLLFVHVHWHATVRLSFWAAMPVSLGFALLLGLAIERFVIRPFARAAMVVHVIVTLGLALLLSAATQQLFGANDLIVPNDRAIFPRTAAFAVGGVNVSWERLGVILLVVVLAAAVFAFFRFTATGLAIRAVATDRDVASLLGVSARQLSVVSWVGGSAMAGVAGIALASLVVSSNPNLLLLLTVKGFAAAIVGGMTSFPIAVAAGFAIGMGEELVRHYLLPVNRQLFQGAGEVLTLGSVIVVLALRPRWIFTGIREDEDSGVTARAGTADSALARWIDPTDAYRLLRATFPLDSKRWLRWSRRARSGVVIALAAFAVLFPALPLPGFWTLPANLTLIYLLVMLSFVVLVGWVGQISLAQGAFVAVGGAGTAIAANTLHLPFPLPLLGGVLLSVPVSIVVGLPALRLRGLHLAVATLAFGLAAERAIVPRFDVAHPVRLPHAWDHDAVRYYLFLALAAVTMLLAWRIQRTRVGRAFFAIRDSETVAAAYGIRPVRTKLTGFVVSGAIAALAGTMLTYQLGGVNTQYASVFFSISWLANSVVAGIGSIAGPVIGAVMFGLYPELTKSAVQATSISFLPAIISSALLIVVMMVNPGGLASMSRFVRARSSAYDAGDAAGRGDAGAGEAADLEAAFGAAAVLDLDSIDDGAPAGAEEVPA
ncbi:MAG TPA: ABC transporter permease [Acidimicrobiales bacterium]|nr:ABC transporter permease [Acidimicrobiales bacterium]